MVVAQSGIRVRRPGETTDVIRTTGKAIRFMSSTASTLAVRPGTSHGVINELSPTHVEGWIESLSQPDQRVDYEVVLTNSQEVLAQGTADQFRHGLHSWGIGDGAHGFLSRLPRPLNDLERARLVVRPTGGGDPLPRSPYLKTTFEPVLHVAMDIVDNCNLRCPFCLYDYAHTFKTHFMTERTIESVLRFLPYTRDGEFWFSCLHEPTLHPKLTAFIDKVPLEYRRKLFYTTNLAKRMPAAYYAWLADSAMHHINISVESLRPEVYERLRRGARHRIFLEGWDALMAALTVGKAPPRLRYNIMVYKSNLLELPDMVRYLLDQRQAWQVELRYTFDVPHLAPAFRRSEFLNREEWAALRNRLAHFPADRVLLIPPPDSSFQADGADDTPYDAKPDQPVPDTKPATDPHEIEAGEPATPPQTVTYVPPGPVLPDYYMFRVSWDGSMRVVGVLRESRNDNGIETLLMETSVDAIPDPLTFIADINSRSAAPAG
jgi:sulfatase maturation enzyme AslB (radical SAM superfamily)